MAARPPLIIAVALNPALDRTLEVPNLEIGSHLRGKLLSVHPAGKAVNVARLLGALGTSCVLTGFVGEGDRERFSRSFGGTRVRVEMFEGRGVTRENITLVDPERGVETHVRDVGFALLPEDLERLKKKLSILAARGSYVVFAGSLPPGMGSEDFAGLLAVCAEKDARVVVDTSGPGLAAIRRVPWVWLIKPNRLELGEIVGRPVGADQDVGAMAASLRHQVDHVAVTLGPDGALLFCREGMWAARPHVEAETVKATVGSGDAFLAGFLHCHAAGKGPEECLRFGVACGTASTRQLRAGLVDPDDVNSCLGAVEVTGLTPGGG